MNLPTDENERIVDAAGNHLFEEGEWGGDNMEKPTAVGKEYLHLAGGGIKPVTVTIKSISGDTLDLSKLSIKVYDSENMLVADKQQNSLSGTISPGDLKIIDLDEFIDENDWDYGYEIVDAGEKVEVFILYGEHVIVSKELKVSDGGEY